MIVDILFLYLLSNFSILSFKNLSHLSQKVKVKNHRFLLIFQFKPLYLVILSYYIYLSLQYIIIITTSLIWLDTLIMMLGFWGSRCLFSETYQRDFVFAGTILLILLVPILYYMLPEIKNFFRNRLNSGFYRFNLNYKKFFTVAISPL